MNARSRKPVDETTYIGKFAVRLRKLREKTGMNIDQLAEASGIPQRTLYHWESGTKAPTIERFPELAEALNVKVRTLLPEVDK